MVQLEGHSPALCRFKLKSNEIKLNGHAYYSSVINFKNPLLQSSSPIRPRVFGLPCWKAQIQWQDVAAVTESWMRPAGPRQEPFQPRGHRGVLGGACLEMVSLLLSQLGVATGIWRVEARDAAQPPAEPGTAAPQQGAEFCLQESSLSLREMSMPCGWELRCLQHLSHPV